jgi:hypothetical protein
MPLSHLIALIINAHPTRRGRRSGLLRRGRTLIRKTSLLQDRSDGLCGQATADMSGARSLSTAPDALGVRIVLDLAGRARCSERSPLHDVRQHASAECPRGHGRMRNVHSRTSFLPAGGARRDRTDDLLLAKQALSQLSYGPCRSGKLKAGGLSRSARPPPLRCGAAALRIEGLVEPKPRSGEGWWAWEDLNFRPHAYQARALTN